MASDEVKPARRGPSESVASCALMTLAVACAAALLWMERPVAPRDLPVLMLPRSGVLEALEADRRAAAEAPDSGVALALEALLLEQGRAERRGVEGRSDQQRRRQAMAEAYARVVTDHGERGAMALRALAVERIDKAIDLALPAEQLEEVIGGLPTMLDRESMAVDGELVAPRFVVRTLAKAHWNIVFGMEPAHAMSRLEKRAFFGWRALHAEQAPVPARIDALEKYAAAGGANTAEAYASLLHRSGDTTGARKVLETTRNDAPSLRRRNHLAFLRAAGNARR